MRELQIKTFGEFSINTDGKTISDSDNRSRKVWVLLAYMICNRNRIIKQSELVNLLWRENEQGVNPSGALKTLFYRVRTELDKLWQGAGRQLILCQGDGYLWNSEYAPVTDYETFDSLNDEYKAGGTEDIDVSLKIIELYRGGFLSRMAEEMWVIPNATYYHNTYLSHVMNALPKLLERGEYDLAIDVCREAVAMDPFNEEVHCFYMKAHIAKNEQKEAVEIYQKLSERLLTELGVIPSDDTRAIYREAVKTNNDHKLSIEALCEQLREDDVYTGALLCEYDFFRVLYYSMSRSIARSGIAAHIALITVTGRNGDNLSAKKTEKVIGNLGEVIKFSLRRGDSASRCSASQYVIMLPRANYENSIMVCERIIRAYNNKFPHYDIELRYEVCPLQPDAKEDLRWLRDQYST